MWQSVKECIRKHRASKYLWPFRECQVSRDKGAGLLISLRNEIVEVVA